MFEAIGRAVENRFMRTHDDPTERIERIFRRNIRGAWLGIILLTVPFGLVLPISYGDPKVIPVILFSLGTIVAIIVAMTRHTMRTTYMWTLLALLLMALMIGALALSTN